MTLHDRIMGISVACNPSGESMQVKAAQLATEADELMALLAEFIEGCGLDDEDDYTAMLILKKYSTYMERNNEQ